MLKCSTSLWSADLANLAAEIKRVEPYSEMFHLDMADGQYADTLLFFPDLVKACRPHTKLPFEVHLIAAHPLRWVDPFIDAGADSIIFYLESEDDSREVVKAIKARGKGVGISLRLPEPIDVLEPYWSDLSMVCIVGTDIGIKGVMDLDPRCPEKIRQARQIIKERGLNCLVQADGGIRRHTVPQIAAAGADYIVPGSLMFKENPPEMRRWLASL
jgi:ribulose-phosphate 3-epimerase